MSKSLIAIVGAFLIANPSTAGTSYTEATSKLLEIFVECSHSLEIILALTDSPQVG